MYKRQVTHLDNAYDGREPATGTVTCSAPLALFSCGGEPVPPSGGGTPPYGDLLSGVVSANQLWLSNLSTSGQNASQSFTLTVN